MRRQHKGDIDPFLLIFFICYVLTLILCLFLIPIDVFGGEESIPSYERSLFGHGWIDLDGDGRDSREELLEHRDAHQDGLKNDVWILPYSGRVYSGPPSHLDIDHIVPLKEAWLSGASYWTDDQRESFANDPINLEISHRSVNRSKGSRRPDQWMPPSRDYHCVYVYRWSLVKNVYNLSMTSSEEDYIESVLEGCQ